jgi:DNA polymerase III alpha subunit
MPESPDPKLHAHPRHEGGGQRSSLPIRSEAAERRSHEGSQAGQAGARILSRTSSGENPFLRYAELHCLTNFSFLRGASHPEELVARAAELGYAALAVTDRNSLAGVVRAHLATKEHGLHLLVGAEITPLDAPPLVLLAPDRPAYGRLSRLITRGRLRTPKGECAICLQDIADLAPGLIAIVLPTVAPLAHGPGALPLQGAPPLEGWGTESAQGAPPLEGWGTDSSAECSHEPNRAPTSKEMGHPSDHFHVDVSSIHSQIPRSARNDNHVLPLRACVPACPRAFLNPFHAYREIFGDRLYLAAELAYDVPDEARLAQLVELSQRTGIPLVAANNVHYHVPERRYLQDVLTCIREQCTLAEAGSRLFANAERHLRPLDEIARRYAAVPEALARTVEIAERCTLGLDELRYEYPHELVPEGCTAMEYLERLTWEGAVKRYSDEATKGRSDKGSTKTVVSIPSRARRTEYNSDKGQYDRGAPNDGQDLSRSDRVAKGDGIGPADLSGDPANAGFRKVRPDGSDASVGDIHPIEHCRRTRTAKPHGLHSISSDSSQVADGATNAAYPDTRARVHSGPGRVECPTNGNRSRSPRPNPQSGEAPAITPSSLRRSVAPSLAVNIRHQLEAELHLIAELKYEHYFLTVHDLIRFARRRGILCQGRGSAANSAVCYCLGITAVDPTRIDLLFERFISRERNEPPDIDVDFEHERREEVFQYIYKKYGRERAGITAEVITYRPRSAVRDVGKALGLSLDRIDVLAKSLDWWDKEAVPEEVIRNTGLDPHDRTIQMLIRLVRQILGFPRHLSQHVGGFVITESPLCEIVPLENGAMPDRTFIEWDKDDIDALGILKVDCLALGMLTAISKCFGLLKGYHEQGSRDRGIEGSRNILAAHASGGPCNAKQGNLSRSHRLAEGDRTVKGALSQNPDYARHREIRADSADAPGSRFRSQQHCGRECPPENHRLHPLSDNRERFASRAGNAAHHRNGPPNAHGYRGAYEQRPGSPSYAASPNRQFAPKTSIANGKDDSPKPRSLDPSIPRSLDPSIPRSLDPSLPRSLNPLIPQSLTDLPPEDPAVYSMICAADTVGVFQIESRAQMSMLPRLRPRCFYDLVIEVAIVRPGPIQGGMIHPYLRRRHGLEPVTYPSEAVKQVLHKTLGVPIFQEQVMRLAVAAAGFTPGEADQLRRAMAAWRLGGSIEKFQLKLIKGMLTNGYSKKFAEQIYLQIRGFGEYGFPESHAASFALLVYASAWLKRYHPAAFCAALLNSQPLGFYTPGQLIRDAIAHGVRVLPVDVNFSEYDCTLEDRDPGIEGSRDQGKNGSHQATATSQRDPSSIPQSLDPSISQSPDPCLRLGMRLVRGLSEDKVRGVIAARREAEQRTRAGVTPRAPTGAPPFQAGAPPFQGWGTDSSAGAPPFQGWGTDSNSECAHEPNRAPTSKEMGHPSERADHATPSIPRSLDPLIPRSLDPLIPRSLDPSIPISSIRQLARRPDISRETLVRLAAADAFRSLGLNRRQALWHILALDDDEPPLFAELEPDEPAIELPEMALDETVVEDYDALGFSLNAHPIGLVRRELDSLKATPSQRLKHMRHGQRVAVAGLVTVRQRPGTAKGMVFMTLEDETGMANLVIRPNIWERNRRVARSKIALIAEGTVERQGDVVHVMVRRLHDLSERLANLRHRSRDFH